MTDAADTSDLDESARALGARIRMLRREHGMTLTQAARRAGLSHSFLSQVERGHERLSMASLFRVAQALGTTQQALLTEDRPAMTHGGYHVHRRDTVAPVDSGSSPLVVMGAAGGRFVPMIFTGPFDDTGPWWQHDEEEFAYVLEGTLVVVLDDTEITLSAGDSVYYEGGARHRWRSVGDAVCRVLVVKERDHRA
ncbi:XRE family transcriptional regulator [Microbacterium sp. 10M-3C3]|jgi:quercetin dioxygenase-like cupin family protein/DNA-binding XRE family transcriptional regulator|uniref:helix-turn-helix domain-containing protein n=1 Tax=Microbacterium sp. 10M-3C3 TaxID=2483401 RepID=UPI000F63A388|nr:XRE family transcriptional regulator [Microbacterium sp. 10M-3C3]